MFPAKRWDEAAEEVRQILALAEKDEGRVLDSAYDADAQRLVAVGTKPAA